MNKNYMKNMNVDYYSEQILENTQREAERRAEERRRSLEAQKERVEQEAQVKRKETLEKSKQALEEARQTEKERLQAFKQRRQEVLENAKQNFQERKDSSAVNENLRESYENPQGNSHREEHKSGPGLFGWNPHSKWSGTGRILQVIPGVRKRVEKFVSNNSRYSNLDNMNERNFSVLTDMPELRKSGDMLQQLERHKLISLGFKKELDLVDAVESGEAKSSPAYVKAQAVIYKALKRVKTNSLKSNREFSLKTLIDKDSERMYSDLSTLYHYCERE